MKTMKTDDAMNLATRHRIDVTKLFAGGNAIEPRMFACLEAAADEIGFDEGEGVARIYAFRSYLAQSSIHKIAGLDYSELPPAGACIRVSVRAGDMVSVVVYADDKPIAWDQAQESAHIDRRDTQINYRIGLGRRAVNYWRGKGFDVQDDILEN